MTGERPGVNPPAIRAATHLPGSGMVGESVDSAGTIVCSALKPLPRSTSAHTRPAFRVPTNNIPSGPEAKDRALGRFSAKREIWKPGGNEMAVGENGYSVHGMVKKGLISRNPVGNRSENRIEDSPPQATGNGLAIAVQAGFYFFRVTSSVMSTSTSFPTTPISANLPPPTW